MADHEDKDQGGALRAALTEVTIDDKIRRRFDELMYTYTERIDENPDWIEVAKVYRLAESLTDEDVKDKYRL